MTVRKAIVCHAEIWNFVSECQCSGTCRSNLDSQYLHKQLRGTSVIHSADKRTCAVARVLRYPPWTPCLCRNVYGRSRSVRLSEPPVPSLPSTVAPPRTLTQGIWMPRMFDSHEMMIHPRSRRAACSLAGSWSRPRSTIPHSLMYARPSLAPTSHYVDHQLV